MKFVPVLSRLRKSKTNLRPGIESKSEINKLNLETGQRTNKASGDAPDSDTIPEVTAAAIAAAIFAHTGKKPRQIVITTPTGATQQINLWSVAGRQDIMLTRDITGQVGFQY